MESIQGQFLVASPHLTDGNFFRSVVLMLRHDEEGALGLVLTRPTSNDVADLVPLIGKKVKQHEGPIYWGGPVPGPVMALHRCAESAQGEVLPGVYFSAEKSIVRELLDQEDISLRLFTHYSGWGRGQLEDELEAGGWLVTPASADEVFGDMEELWKTLMHRVGMQILAPSLPRDHIPQDPSWN